MTDVVVLLGTRFAALEEHGTRWRAMLVRWAASPRVGSLTVVDYPTFGRHVGSREMPSWLPGCRAIDLRVPGPVRGWRLDDAGWGLAALAARRALGPPTQRVVLCATPLSAPLLRRLPAERTGFDAVDDWRALPSMQAARRRVDAGYACLRSVDAVTAVGDGLADRLRDDYGVSASVVGNGVDPPGSGPSLVPGGLPAGPFAVYVGTVQERVDLDLLSAAASVMPVVVAGSATDSYAKRLRALPLHWLGPVPVQQIPGLLQAAAVGLLPHHRDGLTASMAPMKLLEYAAAGLPVVSTSVAGVEGVPRLVVADVASDFSEAVRRVRDEGRRPPPEDWLAEHAWDRVSDRLLDAHAIGAG